VFETDGTDTTLSGKLLHVSNTNPEKIAYN